MFAALTTVEGLNGWWGPALEASIEVGGHVVFDHGLGSPMRMEVVAFDPPAAGDVALRLDVRRCRQSRVGVDRSDLRLAHRTTRRPHPARPVASVTAVHLTNAGWPSPSRWRGFCTTAWGATLDGRLKPFLEGSS